MSPEATPTVSVVVPTFDDPLLPTCLTALEALEVPAGWSIERVVVDNASTVSPERLVKGTPGVRLIVEARRGSYAARNAGIAVTRGSLVAFTDSDCRPDKSWVVAAVARFDRDPDVAAVAGRVHTSFDENGPRSCPGWWDAIEAFPQERYVRSGYGVTANLVVRREVGDALGWFDAAAQSGGDADFGRRLTAAGWRVAYAPDAVVDHPARTTWSELLAKARRTAVGRARRERLDGRGWAAFVVSLGWQFVQMAAVLKRAVRHPGLPTAGARAQYLAAGLVFRSYWLAQMCVWEIRFRRLQARGELA